MRGGKDPYQALQEFIENRLEESTRELALGRWEGEAAGKKLSGRCLALDEVLEEMKKLFSRDPRNAHYAEKDMIP